MFSKAILNIAPGGNDKEGTAAQKAQPNFPTLKPTASARSGFDACLVPAEGAPERLFKRGKAHAKF
jgi:hypothetical protein